ncbi:MAG: T9SS type A sorting domain-containing protein [Melioribacteraceae bacterium]
MRWELGFRIYYDANGIEYPVESVIKIYKLDSITKIFEEYRSGITLTSFTEFIDGVNGAADIGDNTVPNPTFSSLEAGGTYFIKIENLLFRISYSGSGDYGDITFRYNTRTNTCSTPTVSSLCGYTLSGPTPWSSFNITLKNDFGSDRATAIGNIMFNGQTLTNVGYSGITLARDYYTFPHVATAINNQIIDDYKRIWRSWDDSYPSLERVFEDPYTYTAKAVFAKELNTNFSTNVPDSYITIGGTNYTCPTSSYLKFYDDISSYTITAPNLSDSNFTCTFSQWKSNGNYYSNSSTIVLSNLTTHLDNYTAEYSYQLSGLGESVTFGTTIGSPIVINWNDNPYATNYQIWRRNRNAGVWTTPVHIGTVNFGIHTYTDNDCILNVWKDGTEIEYEVKGYYSGNESYQDTYWSKVYGDMYKIGERKLNEIAVTYSIDNYPNPFNPETVIRYSIPEATQLEIKVYDLIGKEVAELVNRFQLDGNYEIRFNGRNLPSGVYIYAIKTGRYFESKKMMLIK